MNPDFTDMLSAFFAEGVKFLVIGAHALAAHGHPRATGDLDLWVRATPDNADRVMRALRRFGAPLFDLTREDLVSPEIVFQVGLPPRRIDILTSISGVDFDTAWSNRTTLRISGMDLPFIGRGDLLANKRAAGRPKDIADVWALTGGEE